MGTQSVSIVPAAERRVVVTAAKRWRPKCWGVRVRVTVAGEGRPFSVESGNTYRGNTDDSAMRRAFLSVGGHCFPRRELGADQLARLGAA